MYFWKYLCAGIKKHTDMTQQSIIWFTIVTLMMIVFALKGLKKLCTDYHFNNKLHHFIAVGSDKDLFFCPGDEDYDDGL